MCICTYVYAHMCIYILIRWSLKVWHPILIRAHLRIRLESLNEKKRAVMHSQVEANKHQFTGCHMSIYVICLSSPKKLYDQVVVLFPSCG